MIVVVCSLASLTHYNHTTFMSRGFPYIILSYSLQPGIHIVASRVRVLRRMMLNIWSVIMNTVLAGMRKHQFPKWFMTELCHGYKCIII